MNTNDLYLEYARVIEMCKGTELEDTPWVCVKLDGAALRDNYGHPGLSASIEKYEFAVAVLEGRPVFVGDVIYDKQDEYVRKLVISGINDYGLLINGSAIVWRSWRDNASWTPPTPKRTFTLNGAELPCPVDRDTGVWTGRIFDRTFNFDTLQEKELVRDSFINLLTEARDKQ